MIKPAAISRHSPKGRARTGTPTSGAAVAPVSLAAPDPVKPVPTPKSVYSRPAEPHATPSHHAQIDCIANVDGVYTLLALQHICRFPPWKSPIRGQPGARVLGLSGPPLRMLTRHHNESVFAYPT
jgi:hypothetical protein